MKANCSGKLLLHLFCLALFACTARAQFSKAGSTSVLRELAKNNTSIYILYSGAEAKPVADALRRAIVDQTDQSKARDKVVSVVSPPEAELLKISANRDKRPTTIAVVAEKDEARLSPYVAMSFRLPESSKPRLSTVSTDTLDKSAGKQKFTILLLAPDRERLERLRAIFLLKRGADYKSLDFANSYRTNKVVVHSDYSVPASWGPESGGDVWDYIETARVAERLPSGDPADEFRHAYIVDRSKPHPDIPAPLKAALAKESIGPSSLFAGVVSMSPEVKVAVLSAPNADLTGDLVRRYRNFSSVPERPEVRSLPDFRFLATKNSVVKLNLDLTGSEDRRIEGSLTEYISKLLRDKQLPVLDRGSALTKLLDELTLQQVMGATDTRKKLRSSGTRYVWYLTVNSVRKLTRYEGGNRRITPERGFDRSVPERPTPYKKESSQDYNRRLAEYEREMRQYQVDKNYWESQEPVTYDQRVDRVQESQFEVMFKLFDLEAEAGKVAWEVSVSGTGRASATYRQTEIHLNGNLARPPEPAIPGSEQTCEQSVVIDAGRSAADKAVQALLSNAWITGEPKTVFDSGAGATPEVGTGNETGGTPAQADSAPPPAASRIGRVLSKTAIAIVIDLGKKNGVAKNDLVQVEISPGRVATFKVAVAGVTSTCKPVGTEAKALMKYITKGMKVRKP